MLNLHDNGQALNDIEEMDIILYLEMEANRAKLGNNKKQATAEDYFNML